MPSLKEMKNSIITITIIITTPENGGM